MINIYMKQRHRGNDYGLEHLLLRNTRVSLEGVKKLCIVFSNNQKLRYAKYHIYGQCKKLLKNLLKSEFITVIIVKNQLKI